MKNRNVLSAIFGSAFFAIPYLALSVPVLPSLAIGTTAFVAGELVFSKKKDIDIAIDKYNLKKILRDARNQNNHIYSMQKKIDDKEIIENLKEIYNSVDKIISTIEKKPTKVKNLNNFFDYYLPITVKIIDRYDEIESQNLSSDEVKKIVNSTNEMVSEINYAFKEMLNSLYEKDIIDMDAEIKVFNSMLKSDGFNSNDLKVKEEKNG